MVVALCRLNERGRCALSQAKTHEGPGEEGKGGRPCICMLFIPGRPLSKGVAIWCAGPAGLRIRKPPDQQSGWRSRKTHFALPVGNPSVCGRAQETRSCCVGPYGCRRQQAVVLGTADMRTLGQSVEPLLQQPPRYGFHTPLRVWHLLPGFCSTCSRREPSCPSRRASKEVSLEVLPCYTATRASRADCVRYPRITGMWPGPSRKRSCSGPFAKPRHMPRWLSPSFDKQAPTGGPFDV